MDPDKPVVAEIAKGGSYIDVDFPYSPKRVEAIKSIPSWRFVSKKRGGPKVWRVSLDLATCRRLREKFGDELRIGSKLSDWGHNEVERERNLVDLSMAEDAELKHVPKPLIEGAKRPDGRMWEPRATWRADVAFMAQGRFINANQPGYGKTGEFIGCTMEAGLTWGQHLVIAPVTSLELVWEFELQQLFETAGLEPPTIFTGETPAARKRAIKEAAEYAEDGLAFWLILNPHMVRISRKLKDGVDPNKRTVLEDDMEEAFDNPELAEIDWDSILADEFHLMGLTNEATQTAQGINKLAEETEPTIRGCMSGTPMGGKPVKLFGALHFVEPGLFPSKWHWARQWLSIRTTERDDRPTREIEGIQPGREFEFYEFHKQWLLRRLKTGLPPKQRIPVWCKMSNRQDEQYKTFERDAELRIEGAEEEGRLSATNVLAEYARLKQFASSYCDVSMKSLERDGMPLIEVRHTKDSGKYDQLIEKLEEEGVIVGPEGGDPECALIFSQFNGVLEHGATAVLEAHKIPYMVITGKVNNSGDRKAIATAFQNQSIAFIEDLPDQKKKRKVIQELLEKGPPRVLVMNTKAGGVTMTLTKANSVHILDETWNPDDQEQAEDRAHRDDDLTKLKDSVRIYYYRTRHTIEEYIRDVVEDKQFNNSSILDLREKMRQLYAEQKASASVR